MVQPFKQGRYAELPERPRRPHDYFELPSQRLELESKRFGNHHVYLKKLGSGPPLLLIHGLMTSSYSWRYVLTPLAERFTVYAPDLPGAGRTDMVLNPEDPDLYAADSLGDWIRELVHALKIEGCAAVGNSLGGYLCMRAALADPKLFSRLVNVHSPFRPEARLYALRTALSLPGSQRVLAAVIRRDPQRWTHRNVHYYDESLKSLEEAREYGAPLATEGGVKAFIQYLSRTVDPRGFRELLQELAERRRRKQPFPIPLMLIYADRDPMVKPVNGLVLHHLVPDARYEVLKDASHFSHVDAPERTLELLFDFLAD
ncbi:MAG: alpha/beta hydrolase [Polyangiaceae bacterium]